MTLLLTALLLPTAIVPAATPAPPADQVVIADGHVDLGPRFVDGRWTIQLRDDSGDPMVWRPLENVVVQATDKTTLVVPADPAYAFLGPAGAKIWVIPQVQQPGVVWPGWNTQEPEVAKRVDREVTWSLNGVKGPGTFTLFLNSDFGKPAPVFDSRKPFPQETGVDVNTHVHGNWTFSAPGTYVLDISMTSKLTDGTTVTDRRPLRLYAGPGNPRDAFEQAADAAGKSGPEQPAGTTVEQSAADEGSSARTHWAWLGGAVGLVIVGAGVAFGVRRRRAVV
ncbi:choice-of-anchor M domain-containing protein [Kribbella sp. CA-293567]|uniref:choice-of-anchor M domain-containing protein n=1 Tax=Kribbella sp. CA-293567 TaxID=3002436 RepID=UPI0022DE8F01|nr:choice-of-anchor M domain-containing protein [Kribbella sp. CA-293567]WBQ06796.1 choice-of-anchor M domain-containing protein [Kribbella sp. CA-293567]